MVVFEMRCNVLWGELLRVFIDFDIASPWASAPKDVRHWPERGIQNRSEVSDTFKAEARAELPGESDKCCHLRKKFRAR